ncbi:hypothetical protein JCM6882_000974 [Rhodosporidiobolus microsporus]
MGLLPLSNHLALIKDIYPPSKDLVKTDDPTFLPSPLSNPLGKLTFYATHRPQKTPKVLAALHTAAAGFSRSAGSSARARAELGVTVEAVRALVMEWGESGREEAAGVVKSAVAEGALGVAEMALGGGDGAGAAAGGGGGGRSRKGGKRDVEMEARGAALFAAVATYLSPPFFPTSTEEGQGRSSAAASGGDGSGTAAGGAGGMGRAYLRCLSLVGALAQVEGEGAARSRHIALLALSAASKSEFLTSPASPRDYDKQVEEIVPALVCNVAGVEVGELRKQLQDILSSSSALSPLPSSLSSRKAPSISPPLADSPPSTLSLSPPALLSLALLSRLAPSPQSLSSLLHALSTYLDSHPSSSLWKAPSQPLVLFLARECVAGAARDDGMRAVAGGWWVDRVSEVYDSGAEHKSVTILYVVRHLLLDADDGGLVSRPAALHALVDLLVRRARVRPRGVHSPMGSPNVSMGNLLAVANGESGGADAEPEREEDEAEQDPLLQPLLATIAAVARSASSGAGAYRGEMDELAASLVATVRAVCGVAANGTGAGGGEARILNGMSDDEKRKARRRAVEGLRALVEGAEPLFPASAAATAAGHEANGHAHVADHDGLRQPEARRGASEATILASHFSSSDSSAAANGAGAGGVPGLTLGAVVNGAGGDATVRNASSSSSSSSTNDRPSIPTQFVTPASPTASASHSPFSPPSPSLSPSASPSASLLQREPISPSTFATSLPLLTHPDGAVRAEYAAALKAYIEREAFASPTVAAAGKGAAQAEQEQQREQRWWRLFHGAAYALASGEIRASASPSPSSSSASPPPTSPSSGGSFPSAPAPPPAAAPPALPSARDYALVLSLLLAAHSSSPSFSSPATAAATLEALPALLALSSQAATNWEIGLAGGELGGSGGGAGGGGGDEARARACREVAARVVETIGGRWGVGEMEEAAREALTALEPHVLPSPFSSTSTSSAFRSPAPLSSSGANSSAGTLNAPHIVDLLASSHALQKASGMGRGELVERLERRWEGVGEEEMVSPSRSPYLSNTLPSRSFVNLSLGGPSPASPSTLNLGLGSPSRGGSTLRLSSASALHSTHSSRHASLAVSTTGTTTGTTLSSLHNAPSLADLQSSLGGGGGGGSRNGSGARSARTSAAPSIASSVGGVSELGLAAAGAGAGSRRRTNRPAGGAESVLDRIGQGRSRARSSATGNGSRPGTGGSSSRFTTL